MKILAPLLLAATLQAALTTVTGTIRLPDGTAATGRAYIDLAGPCVGAGGAVVVNPTKIVTITAGSLSVALEPSSDCTPAQYYRVRYQVAGWNAPLEFWNVPTSASPVTIASVRISGAPAVGASLGISGLTGAVAKGDIIASTGSAFTRVPAGTNGYFLKRNDSASNGVEWVASSSTVTGGACPSGEYTLSISTSGVPTCSPVDWSELANVPSTFTPATEVLALADLSDVASKQGDSTKVQMAGSGTPSTNDCAKFDANGNIVTAGTACGAGGGGDMFTSMDNTMSANVLIDMMLGKWKAPEKTVATLPMASSSGLTYHVTDAVDATDCTVGSGSADSWCYDGGAWYPVGGGGSGGGPGTGTAYRLPLWASTSTLGDSAIGQNFFTDALEFLKGTSGAANVVGSSATPDFDLSLSDSPDNTLTANATYTFSSAPASPAATKFFRITWRQNGTGGYTVTCPAEVLNCIQPDPNPSAVTVQVFQSDGTNYATIASSCAANCSSGYTDWYGKTSGHAPWGVRDAAGTPASVDVPASDPTAAGYMLRVTQAGSGSTHTQLGYGPGPQFCAGADAGGDDTYVISCPNFPAAYATDLVVMLTVSTGNTGAAALDAGLGSKAIKLADGTTDPTTGDLPAGVSKILRYDSTANSSAGAWILQL